MNEIVKKGIDQIFNNPRLDSSKINPYVFQELSSEERDYAYQRYIDKFIRTSEKLPSALLEKIIDAHIKENDSELGNGLFYKEIMKQYNKGGYDEILQLLYKKSDNPEEIPKEFLSWKRKKSVLQYYMYKSLEKTKEKPEYFAYVYTAADRLRDFNIKQFSVMHYLNRLRDKKSRRALEEIDIAEELANKKISADKFSKVCNSELHRKMSYQIASGLEDCAPYSLIAGVVSGVIVGAVASAYYFDAAIEQASLTLFSGAAAGFLSGKVFNKYINYHIFNRDESDDIYSKALFMLSLYEPEYKKKWFDEVKRQKGKKEVERALAELEEFEENKK